jgi:hypothetical protein
MSLSGLFVPHTMALAARAFRQLLRRLFPNINAA